MADPASILENRIREVGLEGLTPTERAQWNNLQVAIRGTARPPDFERVLSPQEQVETARSIFEGSNAVAGADLDNLPGQVFTPGAKNFLKSQFGIEIPTDQGAATARRQQLPSGLSIDDLIENNIPLNRVLSAGFVNELRKVGVVRDVANDVTGQRVPQLSEIGLEQFRQGIFPEIGEFRERAIDRALDLFAPEPEAFGAARERALGQLNFDPFDTSDPVVAAELDRFEQELRSSFAARGLGTSGAAAVLEGTQGVLLREQIGQQRRAEGLGTIGALDELRRAQEQEALGLAGVAEQLAINPVGLDLTNLAFQQRTFSNLTAFDIETKLRAEATLQRELDKASSFSEIFNRNVASSLGQNLGSGTGSFLTGGPFSGASGQGQPNIGNLGLLTNALGTNQTSLSGFNSGISAQGASNAAAPTTAIGAARGQSFFGF